ncbi:FtsK/SpoIIIE domain-containing protein [Leifsonia sp. Le1]|uniref:FtsK/SpoIIIE domain-containing protein n=1 Tax=Leifsonia sp. Le1 TaxID=3404918 RepID=UPI003EBEDF6C
MRVVIDLDGSRERIDVEAWQPQSTLAQLIASASGLRLNADEQVFLDGAPVAATTELKALTILEGSRISRTAPEPVRGIGEWSIAVSGGAGAGQVVAVPRHRAMVLGRAPGADVVLPTESASWNHCTVELVDDGVRIRDAGSTNGTIVNGEPAGDDGVLLTGPATVIVGGAVLAVRPDLIEPTAPAPGSLQNLTLAATAPFNRPPRLGQAEAGEPVLPPSPKDVPPASKFNLIAVLAPLVMAGVLVAVLGDMRFAMFALLSPVMAIGMYFEQRRRRAKNLQEEDARFTAALADLQNEIVEAARIETLRRQDAVPDPSIVLRRPALPSTHLWHRRADQADFLALHIGSGDVPWKPDLDLRGVFRLDDRVKEVLAQGRLSSAPVIADISGAGVIGIVGDRDGCLALARSLVVQAAVHCGPADLTISVFCDEGRESEWEWASWLPQTRQAGTSDGARWMSNQREQSATMLRGLLDGIEGLPTPAMLTVIDSNVLTEGRDAPARDLLGYGRITPGSAAASQAASRSASGIVIAGTVDQLPASCTTVVEVGPDAACVVQHADDAGRIDQVILAGVTIEDAETCARTLAHFEDPELVVPGASLPSLVRLPELLDIETMNADTVRELWATSSGISTPVGLGEAGPLSLDIVKDGPHGLVGGTTGSGKSEFLRSLVAGLAARNDPTQVNFILIDFKGGAAFKACERLPHTIGTISNLDEQLADRALRSLEAEMERRQRLFAQAGEDVDNLPAYLATKPAEPLPRLLLVIDEFAMLAKDFPDVLASLVSIGAVGRTLGVHMILATQRPAGVVNDDILANTNLRVALRVQSRDDSSNVIGVPSASSIGRAQMGRAYVKLGQDDITPVQTALVTGRAQKALAEEVQFRRVGLFGVPIDRPEPATSTPTDANDLDLLIDAVVAANDAAGYPPPRQVWPEALGERVTLSGYAESSAAQGQPVSGEAIPAVGGAEGSVVLVGLADEPAMQRQSPAGWDLAEGNLLLMGIPGSGTTTTLASLALALAQTHAPDELDLLCLDMRSRGLAPLADLPHTVAYVGAGQGAKEQQVRFLRFLQTELQRRRESSSPQRPAVVLIDGLATLRDEFQDYEGQLLLDALYRAYADGPSVGLHFAVATTRAKAVPSAMDEVTTQRWVYRLADAYDYSSLGVKGKDVPASVPGRCVDILSLRQMHIATPDHGLDAAVAENAERWSGAQQKPEAIGVLPELVQSRDIAGQADFTAEPYRLPVGIREDTLAPALLEVYEGEHILIAGPARSGKSTLLLGITAILRALPDGQRPAVWAVHDRRSPLADEEFDRVARDVDELPALLASVPEQTGQVVLIIDDAERVEDPDQSIAALVNNPPRGLLIIAAGRATDLRTTYSHWTKNVRKARCGVLLQPDTDYDGELFSTKLPKNAPVAITPGRGYACVGGATALVHAVSR